MSAPRNHNGQREWLLPRLWKLEITGYPIKDLVQMLRMVRIRRDEARRSDRCGRGSNANLGRVIAISDLGVSLWGRVTGLEREVSMAIRGLLKHPRSLNA